MSNSSGIFRFLDLPSEIRLLVYEQLYCSTTYYTITQACDSDSDSDNDSDNDSGNESDNESDNDSDNDSGNDSDNDSGNDSGNDESADGGDECAWVTLVTKSVPAQILATCRLINKEASPILRERMEALPLVPHVMCNDAGAAIFLVGDDKPGILVPLFEWLNQTYAESGQVPSATNVSISWNNDTGVGRWLTKMVLLLQHNFSIQRPPMADPLSFRVMIQIKDISPDNVSTKDEMVDWPDELTLMDDREQMLMTRMLYRHFGPDPEDHILYTMLRGMTISEWKLETVQEVTTAIMYFVVHFQINRDEEETSNPAQWDYVNGMEPGYRWISHYPL